MIKLPDDVRSTLPRPYNAGVFKHLRRGLFDDPSIDVFIDSEWAFAVLHPRPILDYAHYLSRQQKLGLGTYKQSLDVIDLRYSKIADLFPDTGTVLEVGAAEGKFLSKLRVGKPRLKLTAVEPDQDTKVAREALGLMGDFVSLADAAAAGVKADLVCFFHVFEHIVDPRAFLDSIGHLLSPGGRVLIEVPSLDDPLLSLYALPAYEAFYFQRQHPFVYSGRSLKRILEANGWRVSEIRPYQRYPLENHLNWLRQGKPGGDARFAEVFRGTNNAYRQALEASGKTDAVFAVATLND
jgi:SAM-dependent methyltransferase